MEDLIRYFTPIKLIILILAQGDQSLDIILKDFRIIMESFMGNN